jgi:four helix bundle protein
LANGEWRIVIYFGSNRGVNGLYRQEDNSMSQTAADALQRRLVSFAVKIIELVRQLPKTTAGRHVSGQILRSGTSPAPNYGESRSAESRADFVHKLRIAVKELNETDIWLLIILEARMAPSILVENLIKEDRELACILGASIRTAQAKDSRVSQ